jgi:hypothetical protein
MTLRVIQQIPGWKFVTGFDVSYIQKMLRIIPVPARGGLGFDKCIVAFNIYPGNFFFRRDTVSAFSHSHNEDWIVIRFDSKLKQNKGETYLYRRRM